MTHFQQKFHRLLKTDRPKATASNNSAQSHVKALYMALIVHIQEGLSTKMFLSSPSYDYLFM